MKEFLKALYLLLCEKVCEENPATQKKYLSGELVPEQVIHPAFVLNDYYSDFDHVVVRLFTAARICGWAIEPEIVAELLRKSVQESGYKLENELNYLSLNIIQQSNAMTRGEGVVLTSFRSEEETLPRHVLVRTTRFYAGKQKEDNIVELRVVLQRAMRQCWEKTRDPKRFWTMLNNKVEALDISIEHIEDILIA